MPTRSWVVAVSLLSALALLAFAPAISAAPEAAAGRAPGRGSEEIRVQWRAGPAAVPPDGRVAPGRAVPGTAGVLERRPAGPRPRQRDPRVAEGQLVVVAVDAAGREVDRQVIPDPRLVRVEVADEDGRLEHHGTVVRDEVEFSVQVPDDREVAEIRLYQPRWTGTRFALDPVGSATVP
jgi:hypothetical protein